jgi:NADPH:quinone reductase-like Zn-dependent oxidoreductase
MHAYRLQDIEGTLRLSRHTDAPVPEPGPGQMRIRVRAAGLNRGEFIAGHGLHAAGGGAKPVGGEAAGEVVALGPDVQGWTVGDRVMGRCPGAFAEYALMNQAEALPMAPSQSWAEAAAIPLTFLVTFDMLVLQGRLQAGDTLLIAGVSSGVGVSSLQAAKAMGVKVIGTSGSAEKLQRLKALGLDVGLHTRQADFHAAVMEATQGKGVQLAIDTVGGSVFAECMRCLGFEGRLAMVGYVDGVLNATIDLEMLHAKRLALFGVSNKLRTPAQRAQALPRFKAEWLPWFHSGQIKPVVDGVYPFDELQAAREAMEGSRHLGKLVLEGWPDED